ncbi:MAG: hypothetical protein ABSB75_07250 [Candidatus Limnocylindrales bacterium]
MGILADIFVSTEEDALLYDPLDERPADHYDVVQYKRFTSLEFGTLWAIIDREKWDVKRHVLRHISHSDEGEQWLEAFPAELVAKLATLPDDGLDGLATAWGKTEELQWDGALLLPVLVDLRRLANAAQASSRGMYLWGSL